MKKYTLIILFVLFNSMALHVFSQSHNSYSSIRSSKEPWKFGLRAGVNYDNVTLQNGSEYKFGWKAGFVAEKRLVYNLYFQPSLSFLNKGYKYKMPFNENGDINAYLIELVASLQIKFGEERGLFLGVSPYFTYGFGGKSTYEDLRVAENNLGVVTENTFSDNRLSSMDIGFQLGLGYDFNKKVEI